MMRQSGEFPARRIEKLDALQAVLDRNLLELGGAQPAGGQETIHQTGVVEEALGDQFLEEQSARGRIPAARQKRPEQRGSSFPHLAFQLPLGAPRVEECIDSDQGHQEENGEDKVTGGDRHPPPAFRFQS
jgi:hypothetical protein